MKQWRRDGVGPDSIRITHTRVGYKEEVIDDYVEAIEKGTANHND